jgi:hypothetical protein
LAANFICPFFLASPCTVLAIATVIKFVQLHCGGDGAVMELSECIGDALWSACDFEFLGLNDLIIKFFNIQLEVYKKSITLVQLAGAYTAAANADAKAKAAYCEKCAEI